MRLVCPNCEAQYEVDDAAIPEAGRDVQCSNCGHAWFQDHVAARADAAAATPAPALADPALPEPAPAAVDPAAPVAPEPVDAAAPAGDGATFEPMMDLSGEAAPDAVPDPAADVPAEDAIAPPPPLQRKPLDESLMAVLREEAEREVAVRRAEAPPVEPVQGDLGLPPPAPVISPSVIAAREKFRELSADPADLAAEAALAARPASRRELLPDIEEINSTLRASSEPRRDGDAALPPPDFPEDRRRGFRSGFALMIVLWGGLWLTYAMSPRIVAEIPASEPAMQAYVAAVNHARVGVDAALQSASRSIRSLTGKDG